MNPQQQQLQVGPSVTPNTSTVYPPPIQERLHALIADLLVPEKRENALIELSKKREDYPQLALTLWHSVGVMAALLQVILFFITLTLCSLKTITFQHRKSLAYMTC